MELLKLPSYPFRLKKENKRQFIFDAFRRKFVALTPEEWVRQHFAMYMVNGLNYPQNLLSVEYTLVFNTLRKRCDIVVFDRTGKPVVIVECKAPSIAINQRTFDQIATYNLQLNVPLLIVTNGLNHYCCSMNRETKTYTFLQQIPEFSTLNLYKQA